MTSQHSTAKDTGHLLDGNGYRKNGELSTTLAIGKKRGLSATLAIGKKTGTISNFGYREKRGTISNFGYREKRGLSATLAIGKTGTISNFGYREKNGGLCALKVIIQLCAPVILCDIKNFL